MLAAVRLSPVWGEYTDPPTDDQLAAVAAPTELLLPSDGMELLFPNVVRLNSIGFRQNVLSWSWVHRSHTHKLRYFVHATSAPQSGDNFFCGVSEAVLSWLPGRTEGVDNLGRVRHGEAPSETERGPPDDLPTPAPKTATFTVTIDFPLGKATIATYATLKLAEIGDNPIFTHEVDIADWSSARLWTTTGCIDSIICLSKVEVL